MLDNKNEATIDGDGNIVVQNVTGSTITINPNNSEELKEFLIDFSKKISELPLEVTKLIEEKSKGMDKEFEKGANLYLTILGEFSSYQGVGVSFGTTITNLTREIRYFNQPYFKVFPKFKLGKGIEHDTFFMKQRDHSPTQYPYRLEFGQTVDSAYPIIQGGYEMFLENVSEEAYIQAFVTTTVGEIYSSRKYMISKLISEYQSIIK
ncbi:hypothetical protein QSV08_15320 [Maribacter sp. BPC-D8]|uniref:hypothetical protein n=1 Tax=Maribacter sp. BPC-D8 TaxID=3053613 RepID=UPI002B49A42A|nr:hypothetical protein [Maribacter sp. BPC-D8]WRI28585.1 hypothetical protein QSV08_15320 [Maribacter sp. BPC-D8]